MLENVLDRVAVLGAAGKMGSGISILLLQEMTRIKGSTLILIDANEKALSGLKHYLRDQLKRYAEKNINTLRKDYADNSKLISNEQIINAFIERSWDQVSFGTEVIEAKNASLVFEAIVENSSIKAQVFSKIDEASTKKPYYLSNTSSIPIKELIEKSGVQGRIIGFHFYNPPPVQRLIELIPAESTAPELVQYGIELAKRLDKIVVQSKDVAGFIGNGHFMREIDYACRKVKELEKQHSQKEAIWIVNRITGEFLIRPMGIFQLIDYVGLDVCQKVLDIMSRHLHVSFDLSLLESFISKGLKGGQNTDGSQKDGIFQYQLSSIIKIWNEGQYEDLPHDSLGSLPDGYIPWKILHKDKNKIPILAAYFKNLFASNHPSAILAQECLFQSRDIARGLVADGVAKNIEDVNTVLKNGFYHLYGADNEWIPERQNAGGRS